MTQGFFIVSARLCATGPYDTTTIKRELDRCKFNYSLYNIHTCLYYIQYAIQNLCCLPEQFKFISWISIIMISLFHDNVSFTCVFYKYVYILDTISIIVISNCIYIVSVLYSILRLLLRIYCIDVRNEKRGSYRDVLQTRGVKTTEFSSFNSVTLYNFNLCK